MLTYIVIVVWTAKLVCQKVEGVDVEGFLNF